MINCSICGKKAIFTRNFSGTNLCAKCFLKSIERKVQQTISNNAMLEPSDRILLAVSGGKDSTALLFILNKLEKKFPKSEILAITIDEGISGYRNEAISIAKKNCNKLGIKHHVSSFSEIYGYSLDQIIQSLNENQGIKPCTYCGILRRKALNIAARRWNADKLVTAHTLDDEIQSFILNILHGDTAKIGLMIPVLKSREMKFVPKIKPYSKILESESSLYAYLNGIVFQTTPCPYRESSMRSEVRRFLNMLEVNHPGMKFTIKKSFKRISTTMQIPVGKEHKYCEICGEPSSNSICKACKIINTLN